MLAAHGLHEQAKKLVDQTDPCLLSEHMAKKTVTLLADVALRYPDPQVRVLAADRVRVAAGHLLAADSGGDAGDLVQDVRRLVPQDRLLARDCQRYQEVGRQVKAARSRRGNSVRQRDMCQLVWSFQLPKNVVWVSAAGSQQAAYVAGYQGNLCVMVRVPFAPSVSEQTVASWPVSPSLVGAPVLLCPDPYEQAPLLVQVVGAARETPSTHYSATDVTPRRTSVGGDPFFTPRTRGIARSPDFVTWLVDQERDELVLRNYSPEGRLLGSSAVRLPPGVLGNAPAAVEYVPSAASSTHVYLAVHDCVVCIRRSIRVEVLRMKSQVLDIFVPPCDYPTCAIVRCQGEVVALWHDPAENRVELIDDTMSAAMCGCTREDRIVLADGHRFDLYARRDREFELVVTGTRSLNTPLAILPAQQPNQILILCRQGDAELLNLK